MSKKSNRQYTATEVGRARIQEPSFIEDELLYIAQVQLEHKSPRDHAVWCLENAITMCLCGTIHKGKLRINAPTDFEAVIRENRGLIDPLVEKALAMAGWPAESKPRRQQAKIDAAEALAMWNGGKKLHQIGERFGVSLWAARFAIKRAVSAGLGTARQGQAKRPEEQPPLWTLFYGTRL